MPIFVTHEHSWSFTGDRLRLTLDRRLISTRADAMIAVSAADAHRMVDLERIPAHKVRIVPNGIVAPVVTDTAKLRTELGLAGDIPIVGTIATLRPEKRLDVLIDALAQIAGRGVAFRLVVVGDGPLAEELRLRAGAAGIADSVSFLGHRSDARELAAGFDIAVLTSDREGLPLSLLEYMALGRAIVATAVGGIPDAVRHEREALLVAPGAPEGVAAALMRLLGDPTARRRLGAAAAVRQAAEYDLDATVQKVERLYLELLGRRLAAE